MRYSVFFKKAGKEKVCVYNTMSPDLMLVLINPKVHLAADSAGTFECSLNPNSPAMSDDILERMATKVMIEEYADYIPNDGVEDADNREKVLFYGRVLSIDTDFYNTPSLYCEGAYSFFNDTIIMPHKMPKKNPDGSYYKPAQMLQAILSEHNAAVTRGGSQPGIKFETDISKMIVTMKDDLFSGEKPDGSGEELDNFVIQTYTNTMTVLENLKSTYGGHFRVRYRKVGLDEGNTYPDQMAVPILDWIADYDNTKQGTNLPNAKASIEFGKNLLDMTQKKDGSNIVNCLFMTGKKICNAGSEMIGEEIDVAPMAYYWMVKDNGPDAIGTLVTSDKSRAETQTNLHDLRYFTYTKEGGIYRNPRSLSELQSIHDYDISHVYKIIENGVVKWYTWVPSTTASGTVGEYKDLRDKNTFGPYAVGGYGHYSSMEDTDFQKCDVLREYGFVTSEEHPDASLVFDVWMASSRGLAWTFGRHINYIGGDQQIKYETRDDYTCTGFWDSMDVPAWCGTGPYTTLGVNTGEKFYMTVGGYSQDNVGDPPVNVTTVLSIYTENYLRSDAAVIIGRTEAQKGGGTFYAFQSSSVPQPTRADQAIYLNLCSKTNTGTDYPSTRAQLNMRLWRVVKPEYDVYVTLYGLAGPNAPYKWYLDSETYIENNTEKTRTVLREPKRITELMIGTPDEEQWFIYPIPEEGSVTRYVPDFEAFPSSELQENTYYIDGKTGYVWTYNGLNPVPQPLVQPYKVNSFGVEDPFSIAKYGRIEKISNYPTCSDPTTLKLLGAKELYEARLEGLELDVTALDMTLLDETAISPDILDMISIRSIPHRIGATEESEEAFSLPLSERDIPLNDPDGQQFSIGYSGTQKITKTYSWIRR